MFKNLSIYKISILATVPALLLHLSWLPKPISATLIVLIIINFFLFDSLFYKPTKLIAALLGILVFSLVSLYFRFVYSMDICVALLASLLVLKPIESKTKRDLQILTIISVFLNFISLYYFTTLFQTIYIFIAFLLNISVLYLLNNDEKSLKPAIKLASKISIQALPILLILFFVFPRINITLWSIRQGDRGRMGFSDQFRIDDVKNLSLNNDPAFRAEFIGKLPERKDLYWRGIVFENFDGTYWQQNTERQFRSQIPEGRNTFDYRIILEPHDAKWLFALDLPTYWNGTSRIFSEHTFEADNKINNSYYYEARSINNLINIKDNPNLAKNLKLPLSYNPRTIELAEKLRLESKDEKDLLNTVLAYLKTNNFTYTLNPPGLGRNSIDDFLFLTRSGYCEHYASAFAFLMRAAKIPARVVGGYLGGETNQVGNYLIIRQSDAHVWVEVWIDNKWLRVDPTAYVAPTRITENASTAVIDKDIPYLRNQARFGEIYNLWKKIYYRIDAINFAWGTWVESYQLDTQVKILQYFKLDLNNKTTLALFISTIMICIAILLFIITKQINSKKAIPEIVRYYEIFLNKLAKNHIYKPEHLGPEEFKGYLSKLDIKNINEVHDVITLYQELRYHKLDKDYKDKLKYFKNKVRNIK